MLIKESNLASSAKHELDTSSVKQLRLAEQPRADSAFAKLLDAKLQAPPANLLQIELPTAQCSGGNSPFQAVVEMLFGLTHLPEGLPMFDNLTMGEGASGLRSLQAIELVHTSETESCSFAASGNVCLADGSTRHFDVSYEMERSEETDRMSLASFQDPLMLDFGQPSTALGKHSMDFDLDADGKTESMRMPASNAAVLFNDLNHNGKADDGSELFGPQSGDGFTELAQLDADRNGWIDEGDAAFADLKLWQVDDEGASRVQSLAEAGVGALSTQSEATPFTIKEDGEAVAQVRASSVWLGEKDGAGIVRQVDVAVTPRETASA